MSKYLNDLIKSLQAEAEEHEALLEQQAAPTSRGFHRDSGYLDRLLQRIKSLQELQVSEAQRHRQLFRSAASNTKRYRAPRRAA
jgi:Zn-finger nucleic acid-binding protein